MSLEKAAIALPALRIKNIKMHNLPHPGLIIKEDILPALGITAAEAADQLGITPAVLSSIFSGGVRISPDLALHIERWLGIESGGSGTVWLSQQTAYDQWQKRELSSKERD